MSRIKTYKELKRLLFRTKDINPYRGWQSDDPTGIYRIPVNKIAAREVPNLEKAKRYARLMKDGKAKTVPPIQVSYTLQHKHGKRFSVDDGHHRLKAHRLIKRKTIKAKVN